MALIKKYISILLSISLVLLSLSIFPVLAMGSTNQDFVIKDNVLVSYTGKSDPLTMVEIPDDLGINAIGKEAFLNATIGSVIIPEGVISIDEGAFKNCKDIVSVSLPTTLTTINDYAFAYCNSLTNIYLPSGIVNLGKDVFMKEDSSAEFTIWDSGKASIAEYASAYNYTYVNKNDIVEFGFYAYDTENWIPIHTASSEGHFYKNGYSILIDGKIIDSLPPYLIWSSNNEKQVSARLGMIVWNGESTTIIRVSDPFTEAYAEFKLVVYYIEAKDIELNEVTNVSLSSAESASYIFTPNESGEYKINSLSEHESLYFMLSDASGKTLMYGYDHLSANLNAEENYILEAYNLSEDSNEAKFSFVIKGEEFSCTIISTTGGTTTGSGIFQRGDLVMLQAVPDEGYMFDGWYENGKKIDGATANYVLTVNSNRTIEAKFVPYQFEVTDIVIEGTYKKNDTLIFNANIIGGSGTVKHTFYILRNGKIYYSNQNSSIPTFSYEAISSGTYTAIVYSIDETGNKVSYTKQFTIV